MIALQPNSQRTTLDNTTMKTVKTACPSGTVDTAVAMRFTNLSNEDVTAILYKSINGVLTEVERREDLPAHVGIWDDSITLMKRMVLKPTEALEMKLLVAVAGDQPVVIVEFLRSTD